MKPEDQRIAIAKSIGWQISKEGGATIVYKPNDSQGVGYMGDSPHDPKILKLLPDFCNDLNAMHRAEESLLEQGLQDKWLDELVEVVVGENVHWSDYHCFPQVNRATAAQRAEAFLRTLGKWETQTT